MKSTCTAGFWELFNALPPHVRDLAERNYCLWLDNPSHNSLDFKKLKAQDEVWQIRAAHGHRALCDREGDECAWFWIGTKAEAKRLL